MKKKKRHKISLCSKYSKAHFKKLQPPLAAEAPTFVHIADSEAGHTNQISPPSLAQGCASLCLTLHFCLLGDTCASALP